MRPSQARTKLTFRAQVRQPDAQGGATVQDNAVLSTWGRVVSSSGRENWIGEQLRTEVEVVITTRKNDLIKADQQILLGDGRVFEILAPMDDDNDPRFVKLACRQYKERQETGPAA